MSAATGARRILLLLEHAGNERLLRSWLESDAALAPADGGDDVDLVLVDGPAFVRERERLEALRARVHPVYVPCLFVTPHHEVTLVTRELWRTVDDVLTTPVEPAELRARVERLLTVRDLSLEAAHQADELQRSNLDLEEFAFVAAHELAAPLTAVSGIVDTLAGRYGRDLDDTGGLLLDEARRGCRRMHDLIDDLLRYSRAGRAEVRGRVDLAAVLAETLELLAPRVAETGAQVVVGELPAVAGDAIQLGVVFQNLIGNALKFTREGVRPRVDVSAGRGRGEWTLSVSDDGIGVDAAQAERIFGMFARQHGRDRYPGTGIGLATCRKIVERHGGRIWAEPRAGGGSVFRFTLPE